MVPDGGTNTAAARISSFKQGGYKAVFDDGQLSKSTAIIERRGEGKKKKERRAKKVE